MSTEQEEPGTGNAEYLRITRNFLSLVRTVVGKTLDASRNLEDFNARFEGRFDALARAHLTYFRGSFPTVDLEELIAEEVRFPASREGQVIILGPPLELPARFGYTFSLVFHELAVNALTFGALSVDSGRVHIEWLVTGNENGGKAVSLSWKETGVSAINIEPTRFGFGRELIETALPYELGAVTSLVFNPGGIECVIRFSLPAARQAGI